MSEIAQAHIGEWYEVLPSDGETQKDARRLLRAAFKRAGFAVRVRRVADREFFEVFAPNPRVPSRRELMYPHHRPIPADAPMTPRPRQVLELLYDHDVEYVAGVLGLLPGTVYAQALIGWQQLKTPPAPKKRPPPPLKADMEAIPATVLAVWMALARITNADLPLLSESLQLPEMRIWGMRALAQRILDTPSPPNGS